MVCCFRKFSASVQENLSRGEGDLADLMAINDLRGHDRGIPGYTTYRNSRLCNLTKVRSFGDLATVAGISEEGVQRVESVYESVHDADLFSVGAYLLIL